MTLRLRSWQMPHFCKMWFDLSLSNYGAVTVCKIADIAYVVGIKWS
jgi:hypothetical protein